jgi:hypothetical protein
MKESSRPRGRASIRPARLAALQRLLSRLITAPSGVAEGLAAERAMARGGLSAIVASDARLSAEQRVDIYANMYFYRLLDLLRDEFPATLAVLGDIDFHNLVTGYLLEYPPSEPSVACCGRYVADYLRGHPLVRKKPWLADLAALERTTLDVFQARDAIALDAATMKTVAPERWAAIKIRTPPALKILALGWNVTSMLRAVEQGRKWRRPARRATAVLVSRREHQVFYRPLGAVEQRALGAAARGISFGRLCGIVARQVGDERAAKTIATLLDRWLAEGVLMLDAGR